MTSGSDIAISGAGLCAPLGTRVEQVCAAIRAGINRFGEHAYHECLPPDPEWEDEQPTVASMIRDLDPALPGGDRLFRIAVATLADLVRHAGLRRAETEGMALLLALPEPDDAIEALNLENRFALALRERTGLTALRAGPRDRGHASMLTLAGKAVEAIRSGEAIGCIVVGVDSYVFEERLDLLDRAWRLKSDRNVDGFLPGEAGAAVLIETRDRARSRGARLLATIAGAGSGREPQERSSERASTGEGLCRALQEVLAAAPGPPPTWVLCDLNGEGYRAFEWGIAQTRLGSRLAGLGALGHPADCLGDVGAASGGVLLAYAGLAFARGYAPDRGALLWAASDDAARAAVLLEHPEGR